MKGIGHVDDPSVAEKVYGRKIIWEGLGIIPYSIAPHYQSDHPESDAIERAVAFFEQEGIPYKTLRDGQAIMLKEGHEEIVS